MLTKTPITLRVLTTRADDMITCTPELYQSIGRAVDLAMAGQSVAVALSQRHGQLQRQSLQAASLDRLIIASVALIELRRKKIVEARRDAEYS